MTFLALTLGAGMISGTAKSGVKSPDKAETEKIMKRDGYACRYCGFMSEKFQRVVPDPAEGSYVTSCTFCEQVLYPDRGAVSGVGALVWLPEIAQTDLNHIVRAVYVARDGEGEVADMANRALDGIMARRADAKKRLGTDDPMLLATILAESLSDAERPKALKKLEGVRLVPPDKQMVKSTVGAVNQFPKMLEYWASGSGSFARYTPSLWVDLLRQSAAASNI